MIVGIAGESYPGERRVALVPGSAAELVRAGHEVVVEKAAGEAAGYPDRDYEAKGARLAAGREEVIKGPDAVLQVRGMGMLAAVEVTYTAEDVKTVDITPRLVKVFENK